MVKQYIPARGDIVMLDFTPQSGHEQAGRRPAIVLSPQEYNAAVGLFLVCPITKQRKDYPFEVWTGPRAKSRGVILADHVKSLDWRARNVQFVEKAYADTLSEVLAKVKVLLD